MPLVVGAAGPPAPPPPTGRPAPPAPPDPGRSEMAFIAPDGERWPLTDPSRGWWVRAEGLTGLSGAAGRALTLDAHPRGGARLRHVAVEPRYPVVPVHVTGGTHQEFVTRWRALARAWTSTLDGAPGVLEIARPDGTRRHLAVRYLRGWTEAGSRMSGRTWDVAPLALLAEDPYWSDPVPVVVRRSAAVPLDYLVPYPTLSDGQVLGETTITAPDDVPAWPTWTVTGPASLITATHHGTGARWQLDPDRIGAVLGPGETVTITTDPPAVLHGPSGDSWVGALDWPAAELWPVLPGPQHVTFALDGAGPGSSIELRWHPRYETP